MIPLASRLAAIEARLQAATGEDWLCRSGFDGLTVVSALIGEERIIVADQLEREDGEFIAHAHDDLRVLLALARRSVEALEEVTRLEKQGGSLAPRYAASVLADLARMGERSEG